MRLPLQIVHFLPQLLRMLVLRHSPTVASISEQLHMSCVSSLSAGIDYDLANADLGLRPGTSPVYGCHLPSEELQLNIQRPCHIMSQVVGRACSLLLRLVRCEPFIAPAVVPTVIEALGRRRIYQRN